MPLGDTQAFADWVKRENPSYQIGRAVEDWIQRAGQSPWLSPSSPIAELSDHNSQVRSAIVPGTEVEVFHRETYATGVVDLVAVTSLPRPKSRGPER